MESCGSWYSLWGGWTIFRRGTSHTDLKVMEWEPLWSGCWKSIREEDGYDWVILDLGDCLEGLFSIWISATGFTYR